MNRRIAEVALLIGATGSSSRLLELNAKLNGPERADFLNRVALAKLKLLALP